MSKVIKALYTLSDNGIVYISKGKSYELYNDGKNNFIYDNTEERMDINIQTLRERFDVQ